MIRVLHLITALRIGGAERLLLDTLRRVDRTRFDLRVASLLGPGDLGPHFDEAGIEVIDLSRAGRFSWGCARRLRRVLRDTPCDILHCHLLHATLLGRWLHRRGAVPRLVSTQHFPPSERRGILRALHRRTAARDDVTVAVSQSIADELTQISRVDPSQVCVIENGIDLARFHPGVEPLPRARFGVGDEHFLIGTVARLAPTKALDVLVEAAALVVRERPEARFLIVGEGVEQQRLETLIASRDLTDHVRLTATLDGTERFVAMLDAYCLPSRRETFGLSVAEAMAVARPVVHTTVGGLAALSEHGVSALQVPPEDPRALADALLQLLGDAVLRSRLGEAAAQCAQRFDIAHAVKATETLYTDLMV